MVFILVFGIVVAIFVTGFIGYLIAKAGTPVLASTVPFEPGMDCATLCLQFNVRRAELCVAQAEERRAKARLDNLSAERDAMLRAWAIASAAAVAAMFIPFVGSLISSTFAAAAGVALTAFVGFLGAIREATEDFDRRAGRVVAGVSLVAEARQLLMTKCPVESVSCLATPSPC